MKEIKKLRDDESNFKTSSFICISLAALLVRCAVSLHSYSGAGIPPKFGDFEAQRHWMEITLNLPPQQWYHNSTINDLSYWGLDYPPLTAYQSYFHGLFLRFLNPESVSLFTSRGHESYLGKLLMRWTVLSSDALTFFPAVLFFVIAYFSNQPKGRKSNIAWHISMILLNPCLILIDHGHFQYNCISLGLTVGAVAAILSDRDLVASVLFSLALNHKQNFDFRGIIGFGQPQLKTSMSAYFAPAFLSYLLGKCLKQRNPILQVSKLGFVVLATFAVIWWPYLQSTDTILEVLSRLAPFERGIYEDYVANFWCTSSIIIKWKRLFNMQHLKLISLFATVFTCLPSMIQQICSPNKRSFLYALLNSAFAFYSFSFQVHEKSILLPLLPASFLAIEEPFLFQWLTQFSMLSIFPLICRDKLIIPYIALYGIFVLTFYSPFGKSKFRFSGNLRSFFIGFFLFWSLVFHVIYLTLTPPKKYPFLFEALIMLLCFSQFVLVAIYANRKQWLVAKNPNFIDKEKKRI